MGKTRTTLSDLARHLDLSVCTVSKILNRSFDGFTYAPETIARVEAAARKLGYRPNLHARSLRTRKSNLIGFVLPTAQISFFGSLTDHLELELRRRGYQVLIGHSQNSARLEAELIPAIVARAVDGLVWVPAGSQVSLKRVGLSPDFPVVVLDRPCSNLPFVATENREAAGDLARRVHELGHIRVGVLNAPAADRSIQERLQGIEDVFRGRMVVKDTINETEAARISTVELFSQKPWPTVLFALAEPLAIGALAGLRDLGINIPKEISLAAFDDFPLASQWLPPVTAMRQNVPQLASAAAELIVQRINTPSAKFPPIRIPATLEWRGSVIGNVHTSEVRTT